MQEQRADKEIERKDSRKGKEEIGSLRERSQWKNSKCIERDRWQAGKGTGVRNKWDEDEEKKERNHCRYK